MSRRVRHADVAREVLMLADAATHSADVRILRSDRASVILRHSSLQAPDSLVKLIHDMIQQGRACRRVTVMVRKVDNPSPQ